MKQPQISVIVPVYKAEKYLHRCVDSILAQSFTDFELILINDGSPDNSGALCNEYAKTDTRIKVFHNQNMGVSKTRQFGIDKAQGEYSIHVDSDDWIEPEMLEVLYKEAINSNADIVICDYYVNIGNTCRVIKQKPTSTLNSDVLQDMFRTLHGSLCNKLIRSSCYSEFGIHFPEDMSLCEDLYVVCSILKHDVKIKYTPQAFYHYIQDANDCSITKITGSGYEYDVMLLERFSELLKDNDCWTACCDKFMFDIISRAYDRNNFTSAEFRNKCGRYRKSLKTKKISAYYKLKLQLSCIGLYRAMKFIDKIKG